MPVGGETDAPKINALLEPFRNGACPVKVRYRNAVAECELGLPEAWRVRLDDALLDQLREWLQPENVVVEY